jgi:ribosomal protein S18 acetylase RimI-like enzyme
MDTDFTPLLHQGRVFVVERDGVVIASLTLMEDGSEPEIRSVAVLPEFQRQGIGRALMRHAEEAAREAGYSTVQLYTNVNIPELVTYYTGLGYTEVERRLDHGYDRIFMRKRLRPPQ